MRINSLATAFIVATLTATTATAAPWTSINARQARLDDRIDAGVRTGDLTRDEAQRVRADFRALERLEAQYRRGGLTAWERSDLDRRFDGLSARVIAERHDDQRRRWVDNQGRWMSIDARQRELQARIDQGVRTGQLNHAEARRLQREYRALANLEARYRRGGLQAWERADLDRRFDGLAARIHWERSDLQYGYGYGPWR